MKSELKENAKRAAQKWLGYLRAGTDQYDLFFGYLREEVTKGGFTLADIGTTEEELEQLRVKGCKTSAQKWLGYLRAGTDQYDLFFGYLREEVTKGGFTLADIGTTEEELEQLRVKGCKTSAQKWLGYLRAGTDQYDLFFGYLREEVTKGGFTLADIGTTEEELERLRPKK